MEVTLPCRAHRNHCGFSLLSSKDVARVSGGLLGTLVSPQPHNWTSGSGSTSSPGSTPTYPFLQSEESVLLDSHHPPYCPLWQSQPGH